MFFYPDYNNNLDYYRKYRSNLTHQSADRRRITFPCVIMRFSIMRLFFCDIITYFYSQHNDWLQSNVDSLKNECVQKDVRMLQLESSSLSSSNQDSDRKKDVEIANLREVVHHLQSESKTQDELCYSLAEETVDLKQQLKDVALQCEKMAFHLDSKEHARRSLTSTEATAHVKVCMSYLCPSMPL